MSWFINVSTSKQSVRFDVAGQSYDLKSGAECFIPDNFDYVVERRGLPLKKQEGKAPPGSALDRAIEDQIGKALAAQKRELDAAFQAKLDAAESTIASLRKALADVQAPAASKPASMPSILAPVAPMPATSSSAASKPAIKPTGK